MTKENKWIILICFSFAVGIIIGGIYCALLNNNSEIYEFLQNFTAGMKSEIDKSVIFKKSIVSGIEILILFLICSAVNCGYIFICLISAAKSFFVGFTFAAFFKYLGQNGIFVMLSQLPSNIMLFLVIVFFGTVCSASYKKSQKTALAVCFIISVAGIFVSAFFAGYLDTYILNFVAVKLF